MKIVRETIVDLITRIVQESLKSGEKRIKEIVLDPTEWAEFSAVHVTYGNKAEMIFSETPVLRVFDSRKPLDVKEHRVVIRKSKDQGDLNDF